MNVNKRSSFNYRYVTAFQMTAMANLSTVVQIPFNGFGLNVHLLSIDSTADKSTNGPCRSRGSLCEPIHLRMRFGPVQQYLLCPMFRLCLEGFYQLGANCLCQDLLPFDI